MNRHGIVNGKNSEKIAVDKRANNRNNVHGVKAMILREKKPVARIDVRANDELYSLLAEESESENVSMGELLTRAYAERIGRPELGAVEKEKPGPKPGGQMRKQPA